MLQQQQLTSQPENVAREALERTMSEMVERMGVVHLGHVLEILNDNLHTLVQFLKNPRSSVSFVFFTRCGSLTDSCRQDLFFPLLAKLFLLLSNGSGFANSLLSLYIAQICPF